MQKIVLCIIYMSKCNNFRHKTAHLLHLIGLVLTFYTNTAKTKTNTVGLSLTMSKPEYGQLQIDCTEDNPVDKNMESVLKRSPDMEKVARAFAATIKGTYEMTPDNYFLPTGGMFKAINGGTSFKLN